MEGNANHIFDQLNDAQAQAVRNIDGPCLIIAGAGAGKTRVLTCRIANAIACGAAPSWQGCSQTADMDRISWGEEG